MENKFKSELLKQENSLNNVINEVVESMVNAQKQFAQECAKAALYLVIGDERIEKCGIEAYRTIIEVCKDVAKKFGVELFGNPDKLEEQ